jgi:hypothetical protein
MRIHTTTIFPDDHKTLPTLEDINMASPLFQSVSIAHPLKLSASKIPPTTLYTFCSILSTAAIMPDSDEQRSPSLPFEPVPKKGKLFQNTYLLGVALVMGPDCLYEEILTDQQ